MCCLGRQCPTASNTTEPDETLSHQRKFVRRLQSIEISFDACSRFIVLNAFWGKQPVDVARVLNLDFAKVAALVPAKGEHHVTVIDTNLPQGRIDGRSRSR